MTTERRLGPFEPHALLVAVGLALACLPSAAAAIDCINIDSSTYHEQVTI